MLTMALAVAPVAAGTALGETFPGSVVQVGLWQLQATTRGTNPAFDGCGIRRIFVDGFVLNLGQGAGGSRGMSAEAPAWGLKVGETYPATFAIGSQTFTFIGTARSSISMSFRTAPEFFEQLRSDRPLEVSVNQRQFTLNLAGVEEATQRLDACVKEYAGRTLPYELRTPAPTSPAATTATVPFSTLTPLVPVRATYPNDARKAGQEGTAHIDALIDVHGEPRMVVLEKSSGYPALDEAALDAVKAMRVRPYMVKGTAQPVRVKIPFRFAVSEAVPAPRKN